MDKSHRSNNIAMFQTIKDYKTILLHSIRYLTGVCILGLYLVSVVYFARDPANYTDKDVIVFGVFMGMLFGVILGFVFLNPCTGVIYFLSLSIIGGSFAVSRRNYDFYNNINVVRDATYFDMLNNDGSIYGFTLPTDKWKYNLDKSAIVYYNGGTNTVCIGDSCTTTDYSEWFGITNLEYIDDNGRFNSTNQVWVVNHGDTSDVLELFNYGSFEGYLMTLHEDQDQYIKALNLLKYKQKLVLPSVVMFFRNKNFDQKADYYTKQYFKYIIAIYVVYSVCLFIDMMYTITLVLDNVK